MPESNSQIVRRGYEALMRGDSSVVADLLDPNVQWNAVEHGPWDCRNDQDVMQTIQRNVNEGAIRELKEVIDLGNGFVVVVMRQPEGTDPEEYPPANLVTVRDGKVIAMHDYFSREDALQAAEAAARDA